MLGFKRHKKSTAMTKGQKAGFFSAIGILSLVLMIAILGQVGLSGEPIYTFQNGTYINGNEVSGYTIEKASQVVSDRMKEQTEGISIEIMYKDKIWKFDENDFEVVDSVKQVVENAYNTINFSNLNAENSNNGNAKLMNSLKPVSHKNNITISLKNTFKDFDNKLDAIIKEIETEPQNASVKFCPNDDEMFKITEGTSGVKVDREKLVNDLENQFLKTKEIKVFVNAKGVKPEIDSTYFDNKLNLMSRFKTSLENSQEGRRHNVSLALQRFNGKVVKPNEKISFNEVTGAQTEANGYKTAVVIQNGNFVNGVGGGICQASTTLYNACVLANLEINEVHKHTLPVGYVELSLDAMVNEGYSDMVFTNTSNDDIYIKCYVKGDEAIAEIYGNSIPDGTTIKRVAEFVGNIPHNGDKIIVDEKGEYGSKVLYKGEYYRLKYPREGYEAKAFKETYKDGKLVDREEIRHEKYAPIDGIIIEGALTPPDDYIIPETDVEFIAPQKENSESVQKAVDDIKKQNPTSFNP